MALCGVKTKLDSSIAEREMVAVRFGSKAAAKAEVERLVEERAEGGRNRLEEALAIVRAWGLDENAVEELFKEADEVGRAAQAQTWVEGEDALLKNPTVQPERVKPKVEPNTKTRRS